MLYKQVYNFESVAVGTKFIIRSLGTNISSWNSTEKTTFPGHLYLVPKADSFFIFGRILWAEELRRRQGLSHIPLARGC
jgi:hypothetical protein